MKYFVNIFILSFLFISIGLLSGYKSESSSSGCSNAPEINILNPKQDDNIENPSVSVEFEAKQNTTDLTSIDLSTLSAIIRDNMNKTIDISQYIASNCDFLKKNCSFKGDVNLEEGEYILQVRICNTTSACETKEVRFKVLRNLDDIRESLTKIIKWIKNNFVRIRNIIEIISCIDGIDNDGDGYYDNNGGGDKYLVDEKCLAINFVGERTNYELDTGEIYIEIPEPGESVIIWLGMMELIIDSDVLPSWTTLRVKRNPVTPINEEGIYPLSFNDEYIIELGEGENDLELLNGGILLTMHYGYALDAPTNTEDKLNIGIGFYSEYTGSYIDKPVAGLIGNNSITTTINYIASGSQLKIKAKINKDKKDLVGELTSGDCFENSNNSITYKRGADCKNLTGSCFYSWFQISCYCSGGCYFMVSEPPCCLYCKDNCPEACCTETSLTLRQQESRCKGKFKRPEGVICQRYIYKEKSEKDCIKAIDKLKVQPDGKYGGYISYYNTQFDIENLGRITPQSIYKKGDMICGIVKIDLSSFNAIKNCDIVFPEWENRPKTAECDEVWNNFINAIRAHEAGHCIIFNDLANDAIEEYKNTVQPYINGEELCLKLGQSKEFSEGARLHFSSKASEIIRRFSRDESKENSAYDYGNNHGEWDAVIDCSKCK